MKLLSECKHQVKNKIIKKIKEKNLFKSLPESNTIQIIIKHLSLFFKTKEETKYFLTILGDNILKKNKHMIHYCNDISKPFLDLLEQYCCDYFKNSINILHSIKFRYRGHSYENCRIISINKLITNFSIDMWNYFLKINLFNLIVTACHYSTRYNSSEEYLKNLKNNNVFKKIVYLKEKTQKDILSHFKNDCLKTTESDEDTINKKDMFFLWKNFINDNDLPNVIYNNKFHQLLEEIVPFNEHYIKIKNEYLEIIKYIKKFWKDSIEMGEEIDDELEVSEALMLYYEWIKNKEVALENDKDITEDNLKYILEYYINDIEIVNDKCIKNVSCKLWNKDNDIRDAILNKFNIELKENISLMTAYLLYCEYSKNNDTPHTVSKIYFEKYINKVIPHQFIKQNTIQIDFWNQA